MNHRKSILFFIDWFFPGSSAGGPPRSVLNLIQKLKNEFDFYVITRDTDYMEKIPYSDIKSDQWNNFDGFQVYYISSEKLSSSTLKELSKRVNADIHYINGIFSPLFSIHALRISNSLDKETLVAPRGMLKQSALAIKSVKKKLYLEFAKTAGLFRNVIFHATNENESSEIKKIISKNASVLIAPNIPIAPQSRLKTIEKVVGELKILFVGRIAPEKNLLYALKTLLKVKDLKGITMNIVGSVYNSDYKKSCDVEVKRLTRNGVEVNYLGAVKHADMVDLYVSHHVLLSPSRGENFGHSIIESLSTGTPIVISDQTPWRNLEKHKAGFDISLTSMESMVEALNQFKLMQQKEYRDWCEGALKLATSFSENPNVVDANKKLFLSHVRAD